MIKLVSVYREESECPIGKRQLPLVVDDTLTMVLQLTSACIKCDAPDKDIVDKFMQQYSILSRDELSVALMLSNKALFHYLSQSVPCVGCRRSVERLFQQLVDSGHPALEPLVVTPGSVLSVSEEFQTHPVSLCSLFYVHGPELGGAVEAIPKSKKNRRCGLHSLDSQRTRPLGNWSELWDVMAKECRDEVVLIESDTLSDTLEAYLRKHRFCMECRSKVFRAFNILVGEVDPTHEKGYLRSLYHGIKCCHESKHIHLEEDADYIRSLVQRAEPELLSSSRRERHAKTMEIAQEEVLTCVGICLYARLHRIQQRLKEEEQTWQILFSLGVESLRKNFQLAVERKLGVSQLELLCEEISKEEQREQQMREKKRQKKKKKDKKSEKKQTDNQEKDTFCLCNNNPCEGRMNESSLNNNNKSTIKDTIDNYCDKNRFEESDISVSFYDHSCKDEKKKKEELLDRCECRNTPEKHCHDAGYASESGGNSSREGSDIACSEGFCNHEGECGSEIESSSPDLCRSNMKLPEATFTLSLEEMLEEPYCTDGEEEEGSLIPADEIRAFQAEMRSVNQKRIELRQNLRKKFQQICISNERF